MKKNIYNTGLNSANITNLQLAQLIKKQIKDLKLTIIEGIKDPDQRNYLSAMINLLKKDLKQKETSMKESRS